MQQSFPEAPFAHHEMACLKTSTITATRRLTATSSSTITMMDGTRTINGFPPMYLQLGARADCMSMPIKRDDASFDILNLPQAVDFSIPLAPPQSKPASIIDILEQLDPTSISTSNMEPPSVISASKNNHDLLYTTMMTPMTTPSNTTVATAETNCYQPSKHDIIVGRNKCAFNHVGNRRFRAVISSFLPQYFDKPSRTDRMKLCLSIIHSIEHLMGGRFLKQGTTTTTAAASAGQEVVAWMELSEKEKRNKVGHALRDAAASTSGRNGTNSKKKKKRPLPSSKTTKSIETISHHNNMKIMFNYDEISSLLNDDSIDVDFPIDLNLILSMPE